MYYVIITTQVLNLKSEIISSILSIKPHLNQLCSMYYKWFCRVRPVLCKINNLLFLQLKMF